MLAWPGLVRAWPHLLEEEEEERPGGPAMR